MIEDVDVSMDAGNGHYGNYSIMISLYLLADPRGLPGTRAPSLGLISFIFMQFRKNIYQIIAFHTQLRSCPLSPPSRKILDPPLNIIIQNMC